MEGGKTPLTRLARGKRKRRKKRGAFPTGSGLTPVRPGIKERTNMSKLTGCNYDVNEELQQVTDPETPDDGEFEAWLDSLNERTANGGTDRLPMESRKQLFFATLKANGWTPKPKPPALMPLWQTIQHAWQTIRCSRLRSLPLHRRVSCLLFFAPGRYYLAAAILALLVCGYHLSSPPMNVAYAASNQPKQYEDSDRPEQRKSQPIKTWDKKLTITFTNCRENAKHHISCQFRDATGDQHWVCLMGLTEDDMK